jgi:hypothetical protein
MTTMAEYWPRGRDEYTRVYPRTGFPCALGAYREIEHFYSLPNRKSPAGTDTLRNTAPVYKLSHGLGQNHFVPDHGTK